MRLIDAAKILEPKETPRPDCPGILYAHSLISKFLERVFPDREERILALGVCLGRLASSYGIPAARVARVVEVSYALSEESKR